MSVYVLLSNQYEQEFNGVFATQALAIAKANGDAYLSADAWVELDADTCASWHASRGWTNGQLGIGWAVVLELEVIGITA